jgi:hypothetical protein
MVIGDLSASITGKIMNDVDQEMTFSITTSTEVKLERAFIWIICKYCPTISMVCDHTIDTHEIHSC